MPLRSIRLRFLALVLVAAGAACGAHQTGGILPSSPFAMGDAAATPTPIPHAACTIRSGFHAPFIGTLVVDTAFGQLRTVGAGATSVRSATSGVDLGTTRLHPVRAAQNGKVRYYATLRGYQNVAVVTAKAGVQILYAPLYFANKKVPKSRNIRAGEVLARAGSSTLHLEITDGTDPSNPENEQLNPCGNADGASGTISIVASGPDVNVTFTTFELDGVAFPTPQPGGFVTTPVTMSVAKVGGLQSWGFGTQQYGVTSGGFYIVLCGNVVFATGANPRATVLIPATGGNVTLPHLVFFRDAGRSSNDLTAGLPPSGARACPAAPPVSGTTSNLVMSIGQIAQGYWSTPNPSPSPQWMSMTSGATSIVSVFPSSTPAPVLSTPPPYPPPAGDYYTLTANAVGTTVITNINVTVSVSAAPIAVTVLATPTIAPWPTPMPNSTTTPVASPTPTASP